MSNKSVLHTELKRQKDQNGTFWWASYQQLQLDNYHQIAMKHQEGDRTEVYYWQPQWVEDL